MGQRSKGKGSIHHSGRKPQCIDHWQILLSCPESQDLRKDTSPFSGHPFMTESMALVDNGKTEHFLISRYWMKVTDHIMLVCSRQ